MILLDNDTKCLVQGITGKQGSFHTEQMLEYNTNILAGVTPGKGGQDFLGVPVFNSIEEAKEETGVNSSIIFVPAKFAKDAAFESIRHLDLVVIISEHIPVHDSLKIMNYAREMDTTVIGPNTPGIITPGVGKLGIMPTHIFEEGNVGVISRSGTLTYEVASQLTRGGIGQSTCVGIGGDPVIGTNYIDILKKFEEDDDTEAIVLIGEIGGNAEENAAEFIKNNISKPVVSYIAGRTAPPGKRMGHAGAIISGAYFGDKISPLSETTILASSITDVPLFRHIRYMLITTTPSLIITLIIFTVMGFVIETNSTAHMADFATSLKDTFTITPWLLIVPLVTGILIARKVPSIITLFISTMLAGICAIIFQPDLLREIAGENNIFKGVMMTFYGSTGLDTGNNMLTDLVSTRGMAGMMNTVWLILCAMCFGGAMTASGMLGSITSVFVRFMKGRVSVVASTVCSGLFLNLTTADQYISIILTGNMFRNIYEKKGYENRLLSRTTEDAVTVTSPLIPWNTCGMTQATILNVSTLTYLPYCFFNIISPLMSILVAAIGYKIVKRPVNNPE